MLWCWVNQFDYHIRTFCVYGRNATFANIRLSVEKSSKFKHSRYRTKKNSFRSWYPITLRAREALIFRCWKKDVQIWRQNFLSGDICFSRAFGVKWRFYNYNRTSCWEYIKFFYGRYKSKKKHNYLKWLLKHKVYTKVIKMPSWGQYFRYITIVIWRLSWMMPLL